MNELDFYANLVVNGEILECTLGHSLEAWESTLGSDFLDDRQKNRLRRDYDFVELSFQRVTQGWLCFGISVQVHRLARGNPEAVPAALIDTYGTFRSALPFEDLSDCARQEGAQLQVTDDSPQGEFARLVASGSNVHAEVVVSQTDSPTLSEVWAINVSGRTVV